MRALLRDSLSFDRSRADVHALPGRAASPRAAALCVRPGSKRGAPPLAMETHRMNAATHLPGGSSSTLALWWREIRATARLALPLALVQLAYMAIVTTDVVMMGWLGSDSLAAGSLAGHFYAFFDVFALGVVGAVAPILSQDLGARRFRTVRHTVRHGFWAAVIVALPCIPVVWHAQGVLALLGQDSEVALAGQSYLRWMVPGFVPGLWHLVLSEFLAAHSRPRAILVVVVLGIALNALADYALMFGHFGLPPLGLIGAGIASAIVSTFMFLTLFGFVLIDRRLRRYRLLGRWWRIDGKRLHEIFTLGLPNAVTELAEMGLFLASALLMGLIGTSALAAHAVASQSCAVVFMVPMGIARAASVRVGRAVGAGDGRTAARAGWTALALGTGFAFLPAGAFWFFTEAVVDLFLDVGLPENRATVGLAVSFLGIAALFQLADSAQIITRGALRGFKDTRGPMLIALSGHWGLGLPSAALFAFSLNLGGQGIWIGLVVALSVVAALLVGRIWARAHGALNLERQPASLGRTCSRTGATTSSAGTRGRP